MSKAATKTTTKPMPKAKADEQKIIRLDEAYENAADMVPRIVTGLVMAQPGIGKSTFLSSATSHIHPNDCLFIEVESGAFTAPGTNNACLGWLERNGCFPHPAERTIPAKTADDVRVILHRYVIKPAGKDGVSPVRFVGIDSATKLARLLLRKYQPFEKSDRETRAAWQNIYGWWLQLWGEIEATNECMFFFTTHLRDMEAKSMLAGKKASEMGETGRETETQIMPSVDGQARSMLTEECHWLLYLERSGKGDSSQYKVWTEMRGDVKAKCRANLDYCESDTLGGMLSRAGYLEYYTPSGKLRGGK